MNQFELDHQNRIGPELMTNLLSDAVPVLEYTGFKFIDVKNGYCRAMLPLNSSSSNQHGTHQALLLALAGDYTGGLALASLIRCEPIMGVHEITRESGMSLWLISSEMRYIMPSTGDVYISAEIDSSIEENLCKRYHNGQTILKELEVEFANSRGEKIAEGKFRYYLKKRTSLNLNTANKKSSTMFEHILKTSAKLIAQMRAYEMDKETPLFIDELSAKAAGKQGKVIGERFLLLMPEIQNMVAARTASADDVIRRLAPELKQLVILGAGLDFRAVRLKESLAKCRVFELDLPEMIIEKENIIKEWSIETGNRITRIPCNLITDNLSEKLIQNGYEPEEPALFIYEGCSMYFSGEENAKLLEEISSLLEYSADGYLWMDTVSEAVVSSANLPARVAGFLSRIAKMGEPFIYGVDEQMKIFADCGMVIEEIQSTKDFISNCDNELYDMYSFNLLKHKNNLKQYPVEVFETELRNVAKISENKIFF